MGLLTINGGIQLRVVFKFKKDGTGWKALIDSPDQQVKDIPTTKTTVEAAQVTVEAEAIKAKYVGAVSADGESIKGTFTQAGTDLTLDLKYTTEVTELKRPQTPKPPFPYKIEDVSYENKKAGIKLGGTLTLPKGKGPFPAVVMATGSGSQDRDETLFGHKPFAVIADFLTKRGVAVLRFDDRGIGASGGDPMTATTFDNANDVEAGVEFLAKRKDIDLKRLGVMGHSEGGLIAPIVASANPKVKFIVLMAGTGVDGTKILKLQSALIMKAMGVPQERINKESGRSDEVFSIMKGNLPEDKKKEAVIAIVKQAFEESSPEEQKAAGGIENAVTKAVAQMFTPWMKTFLTIDPQIYLRKVKVPVLILNGSRDLQVDANQNVPAIQSALKAAGNKSVTTAVLPNLNHLFQSSQTGAPTEYALIETTLDPTFLDAVGKWFDLVILKKTK